MQGQITAHQLQTRHKQQAARAKEPGEVQPLLLVEAVAAATALMTLTKICQMQV
jgi:hypothetical protein